MKHKLLQLLRDNAQQRADGADVCAIRVETNDTEAHIYLYDVIDAWWGASAKDLVAALAAAAGRLVHLHINSPGGDVFEARAMSSAIVAYTGEVHSHIDGLAASAATGVALAANKVFINEAGLFMIHNSWTLAWGNKTELRDTADLLDKVDTTISADYANKTGKPLADIEAWMNDETWFTAAEAQDHGFVDEITPNAKRAASDQASASAGRWNLSAYRHAPKLPAEPLPAAAMQARIAQQLQTNRNRLALLDRI